MRVEKKRYDLLCQRRRVREHAPERVAPIGGGGIWGKRCELRRGHVRADEYQWCVVVFESSPSSQSSPPPPLSNSVSPTMPPPPSAVLRAVVNGGAHRRRQRRRPPSVAPRARRQSAHPWRYVNVLYFRQYLLQFCEDLSRYQYYFQYQYSSAKFSIKARMLTQNPFCFSCRL